MYVASVRSGVFSRGRWNDNQEIARAGDILEDKTIDFATVLPLYYRPLGYFHRPLGLAVLGPVAVGSLRAGIGFTGPATANTGHQGRYKFIFVACPRMCL